MDNNDVCKQLALIYVQNECKGSSPQGYAENYKIALDIFEQELIQKDAAPAAITV